MSGAWREAGYADFADGTFGNGGQNLYVSRAGVLQRIYSYDFDQDGHADLLFVNSQDMNERPPITVVDDPLGAGAVRELPTMGAYAGAIADLNGDGYADVVLANQHNGTHADVTAFVYYGSPTGLDERFTYELPAPNARAVAIGDFDGDGRPDIAVSSDGKLRVFYQLERGFLAPHFVDLAVDASHVVAADLDGDGYAELYARVVGEAPTVLWGGPGGLDPARRTPVGAPDTTASEMAGTTPGWYQFREGWAPRVLAIDGRPHLFRMEGDRAAFYPVGGDRALGRPLYVDCPGAVAAALGDVDGDGADELALAVCTDRHAAESSLLLWRDPGGYGAGRRATLPTASARDVALVDLNGDGRAEVVLCQGRTDVLHTTESLIYVGTPDGVAPEPVRIETHDATTVLVGRTAAEDRPQLVFVNRCGGRVRGDVAAYVYYGGPDGFRPERRAELPCWAAPAATCCDFDDDGWSDILICNCSENAVHLDPGSYLYWGGPGGFSVDRRTIVPSVRAHGSAVGDFRHTGYLDLAIVGFYNAELLVYRGGPGGLALDDPQRIVLDPKLSDDYRPSTRLDWRSYLDDSHYAEPRWLLAADFDNDGWLDLFVSQIAGPRSLILWGGPEGYSMERATWLHVDGTSCAQAADLDGDGWLDLVVGGHQSLGKKAKNESYVYVYWGGPDGFQEHRRTQLPAHTANSVAIADLNNDGVLDIFCTSYNSGRERDIYAYIYWGAPGGRYTARNVSHLFTHSSCGVMAADFDEDGWVDLAVANHKTYGNHQGESFVWWNRPDGFSERRITRLPTNGPHGMPEVPLGNIADRGPEEYYVSSPFELPAGARVGAIRWEADLGPRTWVRAQLRRAATRDSLTAAPWHGPTGPDTWLEHGAAPGGLDQSGGWIQYRLALGATNAGCTPRLRTVTVDYTGD